MVKRLRQNLIAQSRDKICEQVSEITGAKILVLFSDIDVQRLYDGSGDPIWDEVAGRRMAAASAPLHDPFVNEGLVVLGRSIHHASAAIADPLLRIVGVDRRSPFNRLRAVSLLNSEASQSMVSSLRFHVSGCPETWCLKRGT